METPPVAFQPIPKDRRIRSQYDSERVEEKSS